MTQNLKIEVLTGDISIDGMVVTNLVTKEELSTAIVKKADLGTDGKIPTSQLPAEIVNTAGIVDEVKLQLETSIKDAVDESNAYAESYTDNALSSKADLTSGKVPLEQLPAIDQYPQFGTALSSLSTSILTSVKQRTDQLEKTKADLGEDGKVLREQIPSYEKISGLPEQLEVMSTQTAAVSGELDQHKLQTADQIDTLKENIEANVQQLTDRQSHLMRTYVTKELGVDAKVGVKPGEYFYVRSTTEDEVLVEYQNVGGVATATGKSYPSASVVKNIAKHTALPFVAGKTYGLYERVQLANGDIVKSTINGNTNDPNIVMTGWVLVNSPDQIPYKFGSQLSFNERFVFAEDFGAVPNGKLSSRYTTLTAAKFAYANIADQITSLNQSLFWAALQSSVVSLHSKGGGEVVITPGSWLLSDPIVGRTNVTISGHGDSSIIIAELNNRWVGRYIFDGRGHSRFVIKDFKIDQNGRNRTAAQWTGSALVINKSEFSGAENVTFYDASDMSSKSSTPQVYIVAKDVEDDLTDSEAMIGSVDSGFVRKCRFIMPDENTRCGFAIRIMTDFLKQRPRDSFVHTVQNCDISGNSFNGDYFWNMIELAGGGTRLNTINYNSAKGKTLTFVDFDKGCNLNSAQGNIALDITYPPNLVDSNTVRMAIFADHGSDGYLNFGNKFIGNICKRATSRASAIYNEGALYVQNVESTEFTSNIVDGFSDGTVGAGLVIANHSSGLTISKNVLKDVYWGVSSIASVSNARSWKFLENEIEAANSCFSLSAIAGSKIRGLKISGGSLKSLANNVLVVSVPGQSRYTSLYIGDGIQISGGVDQISAGADVNIIDGAFMYGAEGRSIRITGGNTTISNSVSENPRLGDLIVNGGVSEPTLNGNLFTHSARATPISTFMNNVPTGGTWVHGDRINSISPPVGGYMGWVCMTSGTFGSLTSVSANTTAGSATITVSSSANLKVGDYIAIAGFSGGSRIISISGNSVTLSRSVTVSLSGADVSFSPPQFKGFGLIEV